MFLLLLLFSCSVVFDSATPWTTAYKAFLAFTISWRLLKVMSIESVIPFNYLILCQLFSSCPQSFPASGSFPMRWLFTSGGQNIIASTSASAFPKSIQGWFPLWLTSLISLLSKGLSSVFSSTTIQKHQFFRAQPSLLVQPSHLYMTTGKTIALTMQTFVSKVMSAF